tara:strand:- start:651 stop:1349 length:699 start_codon:yes stop_codon:yes gene_type:complete
MSKKNITIAAVSDVKIRETIYALITSNACFKRSSKTLLFTSKDVALSKKESKIIDIIKIKKINSLKGYSNFIIYSLYKYIDTSHILIVQWDGYIINPKKWDTNFLNYDYIGAPFIPRGSDPNYCRDKARGFYTIGNGGFSLRSRRLLEAPSKFKLVDNKKYTNFHEDGFFSVYHRRFLEKKGYSWAPYSIAKKFSLESPISFRDLNTLPFGFHGKKMFYLLLFFKIVNFFKI